MSEKQFSTQNCCAETPLKEESGTQKITAEESRQQNIVMGIDIGSTACKCVVLKQGAIIGRSLVTHGAGTSGPGKAISQVLKETGLAIEELGYVLATGYGRHTMEIADGEISELTGHAKGASYLFPGSKTVIDIGGQDVKVLKLDDNGALLSFVMNEKCAAGTGRFLEVMARVLEVQLEEMGALSAMGKKNLDISSTCTVFAESEVISHLASGADRCDIINGIHKSVARRVAGLARRVGVEPVVAMTGGVSKNSGVLDALEREIGASILTSPLGVYAGALGAALIAEKRLGENLKKEKTGKTEKTENTGKTDKTDKTEKPEKPDKMEKTEKTGKTEKTEKTGKTEKKEAGH